MAHLDVNTHASIVLTNRLERLNNSAFPIAVKNTLNDLAFKMKQTEILKSAKKNGMTVRNENFFKRFTTVEKANGYNVRSLKSTVGWVNRGNADKAVENMEKQEHGGSERENSRYLNTTRGGGYSKLVRRSLLFSSAKVLNTKNAKQKNNKSKYIATAYMSKKTGKSFFIETSKGNMLVQATGFNSKKGKVKIKAKPLMLSRGKLPAKIKPTHFMEKAANTTSAHAFEFYEKNANYQFNRLLR